MKFVKASIGFKLGGAFGLVVLLLVAISAQGFFTTRNITAQAQEAEKAHGLALMFGEKLRDHMDWLNALDRFLVDPTGRHLQLETDDKKCKLGKWLYGDERQHIATHYPELASRLTQLEAPHGRLHASAEKLKIRFARGSNLTTTLTEARDIYHREIIPALDEVRNHLQSLQTDLSGLAEDRSTRLKAVAGSTQNKLVIFACLAMALAACFAFAITRHLVSRIKRLAQFAETMAKGDFTFAVTAKNDDELGRLANALDSMRLRLGGVLSEFVSGVAHLSASSHELFGISREMADGSETLSESSMTVAAAAEEMSANMNSVAAASEQTATNVNMVAAAAEELTATVSEIAGSSDNARGISKEAVTSAKQASTRVNELGTAATQISKVTEVITDISEQTNLLALNATIEAARAGEAGKGFAVVANEIKELAKQTAIATQDIKAEIEGIQNTTRSSVEDIGQITDVITRVDDIVASIATAVEEQSTTTQEIATNVAQASQGIQEVNVNVSQSSAVSTEIARDIAFVSQAAGSISNSSATVSSNAGDLSSYTLKLKDKAGAFRLPVNETEGNDATVIDGEHIPDLIQWNDRIVINVGIFDEQHKHLVGLINRLHRAMKTGRAASATGSILSELVEYTQTHFKAEEDLMRQHGYDGLAEQEREHKALIEQVAAAREKIATGNAMLSMDVMDFLKNWLINHIQGSDKEYGPFFNARGIS